MLIYKLYIIFLFTLKVHLKFMLTKIFINNYYRFFKSGFLLDFFIKKSILRLMYYNFLIFNITFNEKYFIEYLFLKNSFYIKFVQQFLDYFTNEFAYVILSFAVLITLFAVVLIFTCSAYSY